LAFFSRRGRGDRAGSLLAGVTLFNVWEEISMMRTSVGLVRMAIARTTVCAGLLGLFVFAGPANATTLISDFNNLGISGAYNNFQTGTLTSTPTGFHIVAGDFGGMYTIVSPVINATGETTLRLQLDVNPNNDPLANKFNVILFDGDGSQYAFNFTNVPLGAGQTLTIPVSSAVIANGNAGTIPGLDLSTIGQWHFQGTFSHGDPGKTLDVTLHNLSLVGAVPEPSTLALAGIASIAGLFGLRRRIA
jgi:hypothetical protein